MVHGSDDNGQNFALWLADEAATLALGAALAANVLPGLVIYLEGDLGAGKTTLVRGALRGLGYAGIVKSPTYTLVELYPITPINFFHFDFYRLNQPQEYLDAGLDEYFSGEGVCLVEWPDKAAPYLPPADVIVRLAPEKSGRRATLQAHGSRGETCLNRLMKNLSAGGKPSADAAS